MKWEKTGFTYNSNGCITGFHGAAVPCAFHLKDNIYRVYYSARNEKNQSHIFYLDLDVEKEQVLTVEEQPILAPGELGAFDDSGSLNSWMGIVEGNYCLYYCGWNLGITVPFRNSIGLAVSDDGIHFQRAFRGPVVDRTATEPHFCTNPWLLEEDGKYRMWYLSCVRWEQIESGVRHKYHIKYAESEDGVHWKREGKVCIDFKNEDEYAISRPCVIKGDGCYHMWFSYRGGSDTYRIGYAVSKDGIVWERMDECAGIDVSDEGWDSDMVCYADVFGHDGAYYMLYNGNEYGMTGFGLARLTEGKI